MRAFSVLLELGACSGSKQAQSHRHDSDESRDESLAERAKVVAERIRLLAQQENG